jgi:glycerophosphoryl diester phosphodiesterase
VARRSAAELSAITLNGSADRIPTLRQVLGEIAGRVPLLIEIKSRRGMRVAPVCLAVRRALEGYRGPAAVMSFDPRVVRWFRDNAPHIVRGLVVTEEGHRTFSGRYRRHLSLWRGKPEFLAYDVRDLPSRFAIAQRRRGFPLLTWTVRSQELAERARAHADAPIAEGPGVG